jgi:cell fate regulator YaaT (PSP1 superfamily)
MNSNSSTAKNENKQANILPITSIRQTKDLSSVIISVMQKKKKKKTFKYISVKHREKEKKVNCIDYFL